MKKLLIGLLLLAAMLPAATRTDQFNLSYWLYKPVSNQALLTTSSPTFAGLTLSGLTASTVVYSNASKAITSLANGAGYLYNNGSGGLSWAAVSLSGYLKADGTVPLTADWNVGAFDLTCVDMNATNFKLSGTGTLTSTAGNATFTTSLTAASGNEAAFSLNYTVNKAAGNDSGLVITQTDTASSGTSYLIEAFSGANQRLYLNDAGTLWAGYLRSASVNTLAAGSSLAIKDASTATAHEAVTVASGTYTQSSGELTGLAVKPTYNQTGSSSGIDLKVNRTETAVGTGTQRLASMQVGSTERVGFDNKGFEIRSYPKTCTHDTATALFGITVAAGSTAGGIITYTLNVTDDDGSDDQIEIGTVQFVGLQDEANWHTNISEISTQACESGTLATTWAIDVVTANTLKVTLQANSNLTTPVYTLSYTVTFNNSYAVTTY